MDMYQKRQIRNENKKNGENNSTNINWFPGHMVKTKKDIKQIIDAIDIVYEVIDARIPMSSLNNDFNDIIKNKPRLLIMTKVDLCDTNVTNKWKTYYEKNGYKVVLIDLIHNKNIGQILKETEIISKDINDKREKKGLKPRRVRIMLLGIPNVGKSTLINRLVGRKAANTGNKPGVTKGLEWIRINKNMELLDTPGILWPKIEKSEIALNLASMTAIKEEVLNKEEVAIYIIQMLLKYYQPQIKKRYCLEKIEEDDILIILDKISTHIGAVRNKEIDYDKVFLVIINDLRNGYFGGITFDRFDD